ncbi:MAG: DUF4166 domain-containing protein [Pirellulaceae bacterium]|nr:DUF4166 domain-containing protein [Pirellulaceae bacterium]
MTTPSLYRRVLGPQFAGLSPVLRQFHDSTPAEATGSITIEHGRWPCGWLAWLVGLPPAAENCPAKLAVRGSPAGETWDRQFGSSRFVTRQRERDGLLVEAMGTVTVGFAVEVAGGALSLASRRVWWLGIPLPAWLGPRIVARAEEDQQGGWNIDVRVQVPLFGKLLRYHGKVTPP